MKNKILYAEVVTYSKLFSFAGIKLSHIFFVSISFLLETERVASLLLTGHFPTDP